METSADHLCRIFLADRSTDIVRLSLDHPRIPRHSWTQAVAGQNKLQISTFSGKVRRQRAIVRETTTRDVTIGDSSGMEAAAVVTEARTANGQE